MTSPESEDNEKLNIHFICLSIATAVMFDARSFNKYSGGKII